MGTGGQELPHETRATGANRGPNADLPLAGDGSRQEQVRDVDARQQQHEADGEQEDER